MTRQWMVQAAGVLLSVTAVFAQGGEAPNDPVSGNWGMDGLTFLELKFDRTRSVSGTTIWRHGRDFERRAEIKTGTFDPQTHALKLTGEVRNPEGAVVPYVIEGTIENNTATGTFEVGTEKGEFRFTRR